MSMVMSIVKTQSLVEQKRSQWAREREELVRFYGLWGSQYATQSTIRRTQYLSTVDLCEDQWKNISNSDLLPQIRTQNSNSGRKRSPSLPPILPKPSSSQPKEPNPDEEPEVDDGEETTSGYNSDTNGNEVNQPTLNAAASWSQETQTCQRATENLAESISRPKWNEKSSGNSTHSGSQIISFVDAGGKLLLSEAPPPHWLEENLERIGNSEYWKRGIGTNSMLEKHVDFRGSSDTINSQDSGTRSFMRGQNVPLTKEEIAERERRRQKALEHQNAIKEQLTEKEQKKREEKERKIREEIEEEKRIQKQRETERKRLEAEEFKRKFRQEQEMRKAEVMQDALKQAERLAKEEKTRLKIKPFLMGCRNPAEATPRQKTKEKKARGSARPRLPVHETAVGGERQAEDNGAESNLWSQEETAVGIQIRDLDQDHDGSLESLDSSSPSASVSITVKTSRDSQVSVSLSPNRGSERLRETIDRGTQTESESNYHGQCRLPLRCKAQHRPRMDIQAMSERPKWGVNRPCVRYVKQSDKDPYYQKRRRLRKMNSQNKSLSFSSLKKCENCETNSQQISSSLKNVSQPRLYSRNESCEEGPYVRRSQIIYQDNYSSSAKVCREGFQEKNKANFHSEPCLLTDEFNHQYVESNSPFPSKRLSQINKENKGRLRWRVDSYHSFSSNSSVESS